MLKFGEYITEEIKADEIEKKAKEGAEYLQKELEKILGKDFVVRVKAEGIISRKLSSITVRTYGKNPNNNIWQNSPSHIQFMMNLTDGRGEFRDLNKVSFELLQRAYQFKEAGVKYRKISGKDIMDASKKLVAWYKKNADAMKKLEKGE